MSSSPWITDRVSSSASTPPPAPAAGEALVPVKEGIAKHFGTLDRAGVATGLSLRHDHGSNYMSGDFQREISFPSVNSSCPPPLPRKRVLRSVPRPVEGG
jgi:hypothetical protein